MSPGHDRATITSVEFRNYKAFRLYSMRIQHMNILVGPNNSGKSTVVGAFRVLEAALRRAKVRNPAPLSGHWGATFGYQISDENLPISTENIHTDYAETDTTVTFRLSNGNRLHLHFPSEGGCVLVPESQHGVVRTTGAFKDAFPISIVVAPVLGPVERTEQVLQQETVQRSLGTHLAASHFRNYWHYLPDGFRDFAELVRDSWPGMEIQAPERANSISNELQMYCLENRITRELYWAGFGFQIWCQLLTHITRAKEASVFIVDEPDIYLHADIQRRLISMLRSIQADVILATHSSEIIGEADPSEIVLIDKRHRSAQRLRDVEGVQQVLERIGSVHNISLTRLAYNRNLLFVESDNDFTILRAFATRLGLLELGSGTDLTPVESGGFSSWRKVKNFSWGIERALGRALSVGAIYDRDFRSTEEIADMLEELQPFMAVAHVHQRKEIENYLLVPSVLARACQDALIERARRTGGGPIECEPISNILDRISVRFKNRAQGQYVARRTEYLKHSGRDAATITEETLSWFESKWVNLDTRMEIVPGKDLLRELRSELQEKCGVTLSYPRIISAFSPSEVPDDLVKLMRALDEFRGVHLMPSSSAPPLVLCP